jgi:hypothetical protein
MYKIARLSTVRLIVDTIKPWVDQDIAQYYEWDAHAESFRLPEKDLIGIVAFSCTENDQFHDLTFGVAIMTYNDTGLERATDYVDAFYRRLSAQQKWPMFNPDGSPTGFEAVTFDGTSATPMGRVDARPTTEIEVTARVTRAGQWPVQS